MNSSPDEPQIIEDDPKPFKVRVKLLSGEVFEFDVQPTMKVHQFKLHISSKVSVPVDRMRIVFAGKQLKDEDTLGQHISESGLTVHLIARSPDSVPSQ